MLQSFVFCLTGITIAPLYISGSGRLERSQTGWDSDFSTSFCRRPWKSFFQYIAHLTRFQQCLRIASLGCDLGIEGEPESTGFFYFRAGMCTVMDSDEPGHRSAGKRCLFEQRSRHVLFCPRGNYFSKSLGIPRKRASVSHEIVH